MATSTRQTTRKTPRPSTIRTTVLVSGDRANGPVTYNVVSGADNVVSGPDNVVTTG